MQPQLYFANEHGIDISFIDLDALYVLRKLQEAGFIAYLVGGSVRDLLLKRIPKDFDISTSARPEQIKTVFNRRCLLIGRRFRLAHIRFGHKVIEVSTFRTGENISGDLILQDNEWGTPEKDVLRRDFTINGLFYDAAKNCVIDYVGGWADIQTHTLRVIGDPEIRFKQDPVRLLRLAKFQARFGFNIDSEAHKAILTCREEIVKSSHARILEEILRMLESGASAPFFQLLAHYGMLSILFPHIMEVMHEPQGKRIFHYLTCADKIYQHKGRNSLDRAILSCCLIYPLLEHEVEKFCMTKQQAAHIGDITQLASTLIKHYLIQSFPHFPRRISSIMIAVLVAQYRLTPLSGRKHYKDKFFRHKDFDFSLKFLKIRAMVDEKWVKTYTNIRQQFLRMVPHGEKKHHHPPPSYNKETQLRKRASHNETTL